MNNRLTEAYISILKEELLMATGCTEPIAIAYCAAKMRDILGGEPERFDVVVCRYPDRGSTNFVKRVVGLPGDTVQISGGYLYVNGVKYTEKFLSARMYSDYGPYIVPEGHYFLMGDNRNRSSDSRDERLGAVDKRLIIGKAVLLVFPGRDSLTDKRDFSRLGSLKMK